MVRFFIHLYIIVMVIFCVMMGNILADQYGPAITATISELVNGTDRKLNNVQQSVDDWNKNILE